MRDGHTAATGALKTDITRGLRALADKGSDVHPEMAYHRHCRDAAQAMERGNPDGAIRHLEAGMNVLTPMSLYRHGVMDDDGHALAKLHMDAMNRHTLLIRDYKDADEHNRGIMESRRVSRGTPGVIPPAPVPSGAQLAQVYAIAIELARRAEGMELSAQTAGLEATPHPFGKPGGPGLWGVKGMELPPYIQNIARALLRTGRAKTLSQAIAIARAATKRWQRGGGKVSPEVRAASAATSADWAGKQARAASEHTADAQRVIELYNPHQPRDFRGRWTHGPGMPSGASHHKLEYQGRPGGFGHARAIEAMGDSYAPRGSLKVYAKTGPDADVIKTSLYNTARMMIARQLDAARAHLAQARKSARRIGPQATADIEAVAASLDDVPAGVSRRMTDQPNALLNQRGHLRGTLQTQFAAEPADQWKIIDLAVRSASLDFSQAGARPAAGQKPAPAASSRSQAASAEARVPKGQFGGGRFGSGGGTKTASKPQQSAASKARQKAGLLATARTDRAKAHALGITLAGLLKQQRAANASKAQATKAGATGKAASSTPAAKTTPAKTTAAAKKAPALPPLATRIATLRTQISQLNQAAAAATAQAARL